MFGRAAIEDSWMRLREPRCAVSPPGVVPSDAPVASSKRVVWLLPREPTAVTTPPFTLGVFQRPVAVDVLTHAGWPVARLSTRNCGPMGTTACDGDATMSVGLKPSVGLVHATAS